MTCLSAVGPWNFIEELQELVAKHSHKHGYMRDGSLVSCDKGCDPSTANALRRSLGLL